MADIENLRPLIEAAFERRAELTPKNLPPDLAAAIDECIELLDSGAARVAQPKDGRWVVNEWLKKAVLLYFRSHDNIVMDAGYTRFYDKVPLKYSQATEADLKAGGARVVPHAIVRKGSYIAPNVVLMPSYVNIGAHSEVVEGVVVEAGSVISMGVFIGQSTRIYDRTTGQILQGRVPPGSVVVPGTLPSADGRYSLYCAVIVKRVDAQTRAKTSINELLRSAE